MPNFDREGEEWTARDLTSGKLDKIRDVGLRRGLSSSGRSDEGHRRRVLRRPRALEGESMASLWQLCRQAFEKPKKL